MLRSWRRVAAVSAFAVALSLGAPATVPAAITMSAPAEAQLTAHILVSVPVTVTCGPYELQSSSGISVSIRQAVKRQIATGSGFLNDMMSPGFSLLCDGAPHVYSVDVLAEPSGPPFRRGDAVLSGFASVATGCCEFESATAGPQVIRLR